MLRVGVRAKNCVKRAREYAAEHGSTREDLLDQVKSERAPIKKPKINPK